MSDPTAAILITMSSKGQIVIPSALRKKLGLTQNTQIRVTEQDGRIVLQPITRAQIDKVRGILKGSGVYETMLEDRAWEKANDERRAERWSKTASLTRRR